MSPFQVQAVWPFRVVFYNTFTSQFTKDSKFNLDVNFEVSTTICGNLQAWFTTDRNRSQTANIQQEKCNILSQELEQFKNISSHQDSEIVALQAA